LVLELVVVFMFMYKCKPSLYCAAPDREGTTRHHSRLESRTILAFAVR
jgi:hypothetical protein